MPRLLRLVALLVLAAVLAACAGHDPKRVYPPQVSLAGLQVQADGTWRVDVRIRNFGTVPARYDQLDLKLQVNGQDAGALALSPRVTVGPQSSEVATATLTPSTAGKVIVGSALAARANVRYSLSGRITAGEPSGRYDVQYESALDPAPGLTGVLR